MIMSKIKEGHEITEEKSEALFLVTVTLHGTRKEHEVLAKSSLDAMYRVRDEFYSSEDF